MLVDVSIDQGGCFETSRPTTHSDPTYEVDGVLHYCVANMPGAVPVTSTRALTNATLPYVLHVADMGVARAAADNRAGQGVNAVGGKVTYDPVAEATGVGTRKLVHARGWSHVTYVVVIGAGITGSSRPRSRACREAVLVLERRTRRGRGGLRAPLAGSRRAPVALLLPRLAASPGAAGAAGADASCGGARSPVTPRAGRHRAAGPGARSPGRELGGFYSACRARGRGGVPDAHQRLRPASELRARVGDDAAWEALVERPLGETLTRDFDDDFQRGIVLTDALIGTFAGLDDASLKQNRCFLYHVIGNGTGDWDVPVGGMGAVTEALAGIAFAAGAELRQGSR